MGIANSDFPTIWIITFIYSGWDESGKPWQTVLLPYTANSQRPKIRHQTAVLWSLVSALVLSRLDYGSATLAGLPTYLLNRLQSVLNAAAWLVHSARKHDHVTHLLYASYIGYGCDNGLITSLQSSSSAAWTVRRHHTSPRDFNAWQKLMHEGLYDRRRRTPRGTTHASLDHRRSRLPSGRLASLELASADRHVAAVTTRVQATTEDCAVCSLLQQATHFCAASSDSDNYCTVSQQSIDFTPP